MLNVVPYMEPLIPKEFDKDILKKALRDVGLADGRPFDRAQLDRAEQELKAIPRYAEIDRDTIEAVLEEASKFASQVAFPLNVVGDVEGCTYQGDGVVSTPPGFNTRNASRSAASGLGR